MCGTSLVNMLRHNCPEEVMSHTIKGQNSKHFRVQYLGVICLISYKPFCMTCPTSSCFVKFCQVVLGMYLVWLIAFTVQLLLGLNLPASFCRSAAEILGSKVFDSWASYLRSTTKSSFWKWRTYSSVRSYTSRYTMHAADIVVVGSCYCACKRGAFRLIWTWLSQPWCSPKHEWMGSCPDEEMHQAAVYPELTQATLASKNQSCWPSTVIIFHTSDKLVLSMSVTWQMKQQ